MTNRINATVLCCPVLLFLSSLTASAQEPPSAPPEALNRTISFENDIHPILAERCFECHGQGKRKGGLSMASRETLLEGGESGAAVVEGKSAESRLIRLVAGMEQDTVMPPKGPRLTDEQVGLLRAWIDQGLPWDLRTEPAQTSWKPSVTLNRTQPPGEVQGNSLDRFLGAYWEKHGVQPAEPVSDAAFMRRAYIDVWGLLPDEAALKAFCEDTAADKRAKLIDTLLADQQAYAENWISFWNDALRNDFQGTGYIDGGRKQITDWLYNALYQNLPYDQFVSQLVNPTPESEGFVNGIIWRGVTAAAMVPPMQAAQTVSQVFLGVNLKCASCHDSFVDHWKLSDSYGMASAFSDSPLELVRCDVPMGEMAQAKFLWPEVGELDGTRSKEGRRAQLARLITSEQNGFFTRTIVNRLWAKFMGRGLIEPLEIIENEPWYPEMLDWMAADLIDNGYNLKSTMRLILTSRAYALPAVSTPLQSEEPYVFKGPEVKRMSAEQFLDALASVTGAWQQDPKFNLPQEAKGREGQIRAWRINADPLSRAMGRPNREQVTLRRQSVATALEAVELTNGKTLSDGMKRSAAALLASGQTDTDALLQVLYRRALQRDATTQELEIGKGIIGAPPTQEGMEDLLWAMSMLPEFQLIH
ncbi:MAG: PSD1 and planctomycete cytochrome C domain-containing protein [Candidatus Hydrogenedentes bacterium]|nr:PSD1 and planctomycete cytochrome C domain-containing protein [Candidatus Hydrogenedentota bacterium]